MIEINDLQKAFSMPLPGEMAHSRMSPDNRYPFDAPWPDPSQSRNSSVMIMLYRKDDEWFFPLIKRPSYDGVHSGQVCLPGGKWESIDQNAWDAALRETNEETGITEPIQKMGELTPLYIPYSNFMVYPQVGWLDGVPRFEPDAFEVESLIEAPLLAFFDPDNIKSFTYKVGQRDINAPFYDILNYRVWGATAMIISEFVEIISPNLSSLHSCSVHNAQELR